VTGKDTWTKYFGARRWRVGEEYTGTSDVRGHPVIFTRGRFEIEPGAAYRSPFSQNIGRRGVLLVETDTSGQDLVPQVLLVAGEPKVREARKAGAIW
jgi:hypothetical protein